MKNIVILGGGTGGLIVANTLARNLRREIIEDKIKIFLFDKSDTYIFEAGFPLYVVDAFPEENLLYNKKALLDPVIDAFFGEAGTIQKIDLKNRQIVTAQGRVYNYDYLVIALGATYEPALVPGLVEDYHTYYQYDKAKELRDLLRRFTGGTILQLVAMLDVPIKCPIAPGKSTLLIDHYLRHVMGLAGRYKIIVAITTDHLHAQPEVNKVLEERFKDIGADYIYNFEPAEVRAKEKVVVSSSGEKLKYDLLITAPPHRGPKAVMDSGIGDPFGFVPADRHLLTYRKGKEHYDEVYVVGDVASIGVAKAGSVAHYEALVVSHNITSEIKGYFEKWLFYGETICPYLETPYTSHRKGLGWMPWWTYSVNARPFIGNRWGWWLLRMYYYTIPLTLRGLI